MTRRWLTVLCWVLSGLLVWAGIVKALNPAAFAENIMGFRLVPWSIAVGLALYLPWLELMTALALLLPRWRAGALLITAMLFTGFALLWAITWGRGIDVTCGCFGGGGSSSAIWSLARAVVLAAGAWFLWSAEMRIREFRR